jgi:hypothetical protein
VLLRLPLLLLLAPRTHVPEESSDGLINRWFAAATAGMSSSSSSSSAASAATVFPPSPQLPPPVLVENGLTPLHQLTPVAAAAPAAEQLCYVHCYFCDTVLVVRDRIPALDISLYTYMQRSPLSCLNLKDFHKLEGVPGTWVQVSVPTSSLFKTVTVRCGHCSSLLTVDMRGLLFPGTPTDTVAGAAPPPAADTSTTTTITTAPPPATSVNNGQFHLPHSLNHPHHQSLLVVRAWFKAAGGAS